MLLRLSPIFRREIHRIVQHLLRNRMHVQRLVAAIPAHHVTRAVSDVAGLGLLWMLGFGHHAEADARLDF